MRNVRLALFSALALSIAAISAPAAQQSDKAKKPPKQTHDKGIDDPDPAPGLRRPTGERAIENVTVVKRADGVELAALDESFEDALVATVKADGTIAFVCLHGLPAGAKHLDAVPRPVSTVPVLEEK